MTFNHYLSSPKHSIETLFFKILNKNPKLNEILNRIPYPLHRNILFKYWGELIPFDNAILSHNSREYRQPNIELLDMLRFY